MPVTAWRNLEVTPCIKLESMNFKKANKLSELLLRISLQTMIQCYCILLWRQLSGNDDLSVSACMHGHWLSLGDCRSKTAVCWVKCNVLSSHFLISYFSFLISSFLLLEWPHTNCRYGCNPSSTRLVSCPDPRERRVRCSCYMGRGQTA